MLNRALVLRVDVSTSVLRHDLMHSADSGSHAIAVTDSDARRVVGVWLPEPAPEPAPAPVPAPPAAEPLLSPPLPLPLVLPQQRLSTMTQTSDHRQWTRRLMADLALVMLRRSSPTIAGCR